MDPSYTFLTLPFPKSCGLQLRPLFFALTMRFPTILIAIFASLIFTAALPTDVSFSEDLKAAIAQKRAQERAFANSESLSEENRAYNLERVEVATFRYKQDLNTDVLNSRSEPGKRAVGRSGRSASRTDLDH